MVKNIMEELRNPDTNMIGVYGFGGVGKTTLAKEVFRQAVQDKFFHDVVIILNVKEKKHPEKIQKEIAEKLGMDVNESDSIDVRANCVWSRIKEKQTLVILDDILVRIDFDALGLLHAPNCKIFLTSRYQNVIFYERRTQKLFPLELLREEESWSLFEKMAGDVVKGDRIRKVAIQVAQKCGGLPVLVVAVASALRGSTIEEWKDALKRFKSFDKRGLIETAFLALEWSCNQLDAEELKPLFLLCATMAGRSEIDLSDLLKYSIGLGLVKNVDTAEDARNGLHSLVKHLKDSCLLLEGYDDETVRMHDLVRDVAAQIASRDKHVYSRVYEELGEFPSKEFSLVSLRYCTIPKLPDVPWELPKLKLFFLGTRDESLKLPNNFFNEMKQLKVLDLTGLHFPASLPSSLKSLTNLQTLCLDQCALVDVALVGQLKSLKVLSLMHSKVEELPKKLDQLTRLQLLDLRYCSELVRISPDVISSLTRLEDLRMGVNSFKKWDGEGVMRRTNASISELRNMTNLTALEIYIPDADLLPPNLFSDKLERYNIVVGDRWLFPNNTYENSSKILKLKLPKSGQLDQGLKSLLKRCEHLYLDGGMEGVNIIRYLLGSDGAENLKHLHLQNNDEVTSVINSISWSCSHNAFPMLESLSLENLVNLESVCYGQLRVTDELPFRKLRSLTFKNLPKLIGFSSQGMSVITTTTQGQITNYTEAEEIILENEIDGPTKQYFMNGEVSIPHLTSLILHQCDGIRFLFSCSMATSLVQLKTLRIYKCQNIEEIVPPTDDQSGEENTSYQNMFCQLQDLKLQHLPSLRNIFPASVAKHLKQLRVLHVENCGLLIQIVSEEGRDQPTPEFVFPEVTSVRFDKLPKLRSFYPGLHVSKWPSLVTLTFFQCGNVEIFSAEFSRFRDILNLGFSAPIKQPFFLIPEDNSFSKLESSVLDENTEIWHQWYGPVRAELFRNLIIIAFSRPQLKSNMFLENLEKLYVRSTTWKEMFTPSYGGVHGGVVTLRHVKLLCIKKMQELLHLEIDYDNYSSQQPPPPAAPVFPNLEILQLYFCSRLENILSSSLISFENLTILDIWGCDGLVYLTTYSAAKCLQQLKKLTVMYCERFVEIVASDDSDDDSGNGNEIAFNGLEYLKLSNLPNLVGFCSGNCTVKVLLSDSETEGLQITEIQEEDKYSWIWWLVNVYLHRVLLFLGISCIFACLVGTCLGMQSTRESCVRLP